jgi:hypothetical protein
VFECEVCRCFFGGFSCFWQKKCSQQPSTLRHARGLHARTLHTHNRTFLAFCDQPAPPPSLRYDAHQARERGQAQREHRELAAAAQGHQAGAAGPQQARPPQEERPPRRRGGAVSGKTLWRYRGSSQLTHSLKAPGFNHVRNWFQSLLSNSTNLYHYALDHDKLAPPKKKDTGGGGGGGGGRGGGGGGGGGAVGVGGAAAVGAVGAVGAGDGSFSTGIADTVKTTMRRAAGGGGGGAGAMTIPPQGSPASPPQLPPTPKKPAGGNAREAAALSSRSSPRFLTKCGKVAAQPHA